MSLPDLPATGETNFDSKVRTTLTAWRDSFESKAEGDHSHGAGGVVISIVANEAALGTGSTDGEMKITAEPGEIWIWDDGGAAWIKRSGSRVGVPYPWLTETPPDDSVEYDGSAVSRTTYARLFAIFGTTFGVGDGSTTFNLPDMRGEFLRGWDHGAGKDPDAASRTDRGDGTAGDHVGTKQPSAMEEHEHTVKVVGTVAGTGGGRVCQADNTLSTNQAGYLNNAGTSTENRPRNIYVMWCAEY